ncbi:glutathione S-transferase N-terminal domain-containing protein [Chelativorans sp.]|uniref:glutathione S-transferase N-terminal domain-containing protein n=1 Tax=Chelativorans sp. TaxID=2203393 RepID=UPI002811705F|nr:glutathione S-transferase N-terminal domain-containing protein [Chelativorans sp.]
MKLYMTPGACSLSDHIALNEAGLHYEMVRVDIPTRKTEKGEDFTKVNPKGYVPALVLDDGTVLTENAAILLWIAEQAPHLKPKDVMARVRLVEALSFIGAEIHKPFIRSFFAPREEDKAEARNAVMGRLQTIADAMKHDHLLGTAFSTADAYLYVMLRWAKGSQMELPAPLGAYFERIGNRPAVRAALQEEGLEEAA